MGLAWVGEETSQIIGPFTLIDMAWGGEREKSGKWAINANEYCLRRVPFSKWVCNFIGLKILMCLARGVTMTQHPVRGI